MLTVSKICALITMTVIENGWPTPPITLTNKNGNFVIHHIIVVIDELTVLFRFEHIFQNKKKNQIEK